jgi:hypothetical protein
MTHDAMQLSVSMSRAFARDDNLPAVAVRLTRAAPADLTAATRIVHAAKVTVRALQLSLKMTIVVGILVGAIGLFVGPRAFHGFVESAEKAAFLRTQHFVEAHTEWSMTHDAPCPHDLEELTGYMSSKELNDPWGTRYAMACAVYEGVLFGIVSAGVDRQFGTLDDVRSWEHRRKQIEVL